ncbi:hypothetical protein JQ633_24135 [Bradyrhizobium tropiciagri]|uniref:hypothetical protein n=1 Tax=Bradyrhizobium tropiciagri TaxID=312253 RepID=UPI001BA49F5E|nr:hypothetical protein [Bradyrhizobium tropiciagri]MBR0873468.1 hypothetical protein [Bradyrhizobium tropiciagri]
MAKKSKKAAKKKAKKVVKAKAMKALTPVYMKATARPTAIGAHDVADLLATIESQGLGAKFRRAAKAGGHTVTVAPKTVNFVKDFLAKNMMHSHSVAKKAINSAGTFDCS